MKQALISDVHGNLEALQAVLDDIEKQGVDEIICLGDTIGYGADSVACLDLVLESCSIVLAGNHEWAYRQGGTEDFHGLAADALEVARNQLDSEGATEDRNRRREAIQAMEFGLRRENHLYVHASPIDPVWDYVLPSYFEAEWSEEHLRAIFKHVDSLCFCGHSHCPCVITQDFACGWPREEDERFSLAQPMKYLINVGSVGQPRDRDPRACYALLENDVEILFRRIEYPIPRAQRKIYDTPGLHPFLAQRLAEGE